MAQSERSRPNLFGYATKELSQDAMICWLLEWANSEYRETDSALCDTGRRFAQALLAKHGQKIEVETIEKVEVWRQWDRIDVLARINGAQVLLIEDKTDSNDHSDQLQRYYDAVQDEFPDADICPIYFKTGNYEHGERKRIEKHSGYRFFDRCDFLDVLRTYPGQNASLKDFLDYLQGLEDRTNSYRQWTKDAPSDDREAWQGFFKHLEKELGGGWSYVPNQSGGFQCFSWGRSDAYMQLQVKPEDAERQQLCFKINAGDASAEEQGRLRDEYHQQIMHTGGDRVCRPRRMGRGQTMTVAMWGQNPNERTWLKFGAEGKLDIEGTISQLKEAEAVLEKA